MLKKTVRYEDLDSNFVEDDFYFHFNKLELSRMALKYQARGGLDKYFAKLVKTQNAVQLIELIEDIVQGSYGKRSEDGRSFVKSPEVLADFMGRDAYNVLVMELASQPEKLNEFLLGMGTSEIRKMVEEQREKVAKDPTASQQVFDTNDFTISQRELDVKQKFASERAPEKTALTPEDFTEQELYDMSREDLDRLIAGVLYEKPNIESFSIEELRAMSDDDFQRLAGKDPKKWSKRTLVVASIRKTRK